MDRFLHQITELPGLWVNVGNPMGSSSNKILHKMPLKGQDFLTLLLQKDLWNCFEMVWLLRPVTCVRKSRHSYLGSFQTGNSVLIVSAECFFGLFINCITLALALILMLVSNCALWRSLSYTTRNLILREGKDIL